MSDFLILISKAGQSCPHINIGKKKKNQATHTAIPYSRLEKLIMNLMQTNSCDQLHEYGVALLAH